MTPFPRLSDEEAALMAKAMGTPAMSCLVGLLRARLEHAEEILCGAPNDRDEHIAIGSLRALRDLLAELEGAPMRADANAKRTAAGGTSPGKDVYG